MNSVWSLGRAGLGLVLLIAGLAAVQPAQAQQEGFYIGIAYGQAKKEADIAPYDAYAQGFFAEVGFIPTSVSTRIDDTDGAYGFVGGYRFTPHWAIEGGYAQLGNIKYRATATGASPAGQDSSNFNVDNSTSGIIVSGLGILPLSYTMEVYGRVGVMLTTTSIQTYYREGIRGEASGEESASSTDLLAGAGVSLSFLEIYSLRLEYMRVFDAGKDPSFGEADLDMMSLGVTVMF
jgi:OmpA-like transmembrane domain